MRWLDSQRNPNSHYMCTVEKIIDETPTVRTLIFTDQLLSKVLPGQFAMVWIPGVNELPMRRNGNTREMVKLHLQLESEANHQLECIIFLWVIISGFVVHMEIVLT